MHPDLPTNGHADPATASAGTTATGAVAPGAGPADRPPPLIPSHIAWPGFVVLLLLMSITAAVVTVVAANSDGGAQVVREAPSGTGEPSAFLSISHPLICGVHPSAIATSHVRE